MTRPPRSRQDAAVPDPFSVERTESTGTVVLALKGELDLAAVPHLVEAAAEIPAGAQLVIDLADLEFMDSSGLRALMNLDLRARREGWEITLARPQRAVMRLLDLTHVGDRIPIRDAPA
jgi:anti-sigma B factor antagonist